MKWVTREKPKVDRVACPGLIKNFIDPVAELLFVPATDVMTIATDEMAIPYDVPDVELSHHDGACSFEAIVASYELDDPAIKLLAKIVRGADTDDRGYMPQSAGLRAISQGWHLLDWPTARRLEVGFAVYDCLYAWCQAQVGA